MARSPLSQRKPPASIRRASLQPRGVWRPATNRVALSRRRNAISTSTADRLRRANRPGQWMVSGPGKPSSRRQRRIEEAQIHSRKPLYRRGGFWGAIGSFVVAAGLGLLGWVLLRPNQPVERYKPEAPLIAPEVPGQRKVELPKPVSKKPEEPTTTEKPARNGKEPRKKTPEEEAAERASEQFDRGVKGVTSGREKIEKVLKDLKIKPTHKLVWEYSRGDANGWIDMVAENQTVYRGDTSNPGSVFYGVVKSTSPLTIVDQDGYTHYSWNSFLPPKTYVQFLYGGTKQ